jgi:hypothetical protein
VIWTAENQEEFDKGTPGLYALIASPVSDPDTGFSYTLAAGVLAPRIAVMLTPGITPQFMPQAARAPGRVQGVGTAESPLILTNADQLAEIAALVNDGELEAFVFGDYADRNQIHMTLDADIFLANYGKNSIGFNEGRGWVPIGTDTNPFRGVFDGGGHTVTGLYIGDAGLDFAGLFGKVGEAKAGVPEAAIRNTGLQAVSVSAGNNTGGLAGRIENAAVTGCRVTGAVSGKDAAGGLIGAVAAGGGVTNCYTTNAVSGAGGAGGIAGLVASGGKVTSSYATGAAAGDQNIGGIAGAVIGTGQVANCAALNPRVTAASANAGRVAGTSNGGALSGNVAFGGMTAGTQTVPESDSEAIKAGRHGESRNAMVLQDLTAIEVFPFSVGADQNTWTYEKNADVLPGLFGKTVPMPAHLCAVAEPYLIETAEQLALLAKHVNAGTSREDGYGRADAHYRLKNDIDLSGYDASNTEFNGGNGWTPIGTYENPFKGVFDGDGKEIKGIFVRKTDYGGGIFGYVVGAETDPAEIKNLGVRDVAIEAFGGVGGVAGCVEYGNLTACYATGAVTGGVYIGGLVGNLYSGTLANCRTAVRVTASGSYGGGSVGGVVGTMNNSTVTGCYATGDVVEGNYWKTHIGGVAGTVGNSTVTDCYATGDITFTNSGSGYIGGIAGWVSWDALVTNCYATGDITGGGSVGGVAGRVSGTGATLTNCYATGTVSGSTYVGGVAGDIVIGNIINCAALNPSVTTGSSNGTYIGRVVGRRWDNTDATLVVTISNNIAFSGMSVKIGSNQKTPANDKDGQDGLGKTKEELQNAAGFSLTGLTAPPWTYYEGRLPGLGGVSADMPAHLRIKPFAGAGTEEEPYLIETAAQLALLADIVEGGTADYGWHDFFDKHYELTNDLDLSAYGVGTSFNGGKGWLPIGTISDMREEPTQEVWSFIGTFDGKDHVITGLSARDSSRSTVGLGLFGRVDGSKEKPAAIKNLHLENVNIFGQYLVGGVVGQINYGNIENCSVTGSVGANLYSHNYLRINNESLAGGIVGWVLYGGTVSDCTMTGTVSGKGQYVGGIAGAIQTKTADADAAIRDCVATGAVSSVNDGSNSNSMVGGIVGWVGGVGNEIVENCRTQVTVSGNDYIGGIAGYIRSANREAGIKKCVATGTVNAAGDYAGGIAGSVAYGGAAEDCYATGEVNAAGDYAGGIAGYLGRTDENVAANLKSCYATGAVNSAGDYAGGIAGAVANKGAVENCYATGAVSGFDYVGGAVGSIYYGSLVKDCYATGTVRGNDYVGGVTGEVYGDSDSLINCVALNPSVTARAESAYAGRVAGYRASDAILLNNAAFDAVKVTENGTQRGVTEGQGEAVGNKRDGLSVPVFDVTDASGRTVLKYGFSNPLFWSSSADPERGGMGWNGETVWLFEKDRLPVLRALGGAQTGDAGLYNSGRKLRFSDVTINVPAGAHVYNGAAHTLRSAGSDPEITVTFGSAILREGRDYRLEYENNIDAGTVKVTALGMGDYEDGKSGAFTVAPKPVRVTGLLASKVYDGSAAFSAGQIAWTSAAFAAGDIEERDEGTVSFTGRENARGVAASASAGTHALTVTGFALDGTRAHNYSLITEAAGTAVIVAGGPGGGTGGGNTGGETGGSEGGSDGGSDGDGGSTGDTGGGDTGGTSGGDAGGTENTGGTETGTDGTSSGGTDPSVPPVPTGAGNALAPVADTSGGAAYVEIGEDGTPLGEWHYDDGQNAWIFDAYTPLGALPQTGAFSAPGGMLRPSAAMGGALLALPLLALLLYAAAELFRRRARGLS